LINKPGCQKFRCQLRTAFDQDVDASLGPQLGENILKVPGAQVGCRRCVLGGAKNPRIDGQLPRANHDTAWLAGTLQSAWPRGELRVIGEHRPRADDNRITKAPIRMDIRPR